MSTHPVTPHNLSQNSYRFDLFLSSNFSSLKDITQVYGLVLDNQNRVLVVFDQHNDWLLPGGAVEKGETLIDTLKREIWEEVQVRVDEKSLKPFFYQKVYLKDKFGKWQYVTTQVRFICRPKEIGKFVPGMPPDRMKKRMFVEIAKLDQYLNWGETTPFIQREIKKFL